MLEKHDIYDHLSKMTRGQRYHNEMVDKRNMMSDLVHTFYLYHSLSRGVWTRKFFFLFFQYAI